MSTTYIASHDGFTFKRTTERRTYTHVVVTKCSRRADRASCAAQARKRFAGDIDYYTRMADGREPRANYQTELAYAAERAEAQHIVRRGVEHYVAEQLCAFDVRHEGRPCAADGDTYYSVMGWAGRPDLAAKLAARTGGIIIEATPKVKR